MASVTNGESVVQIPIIDISPDNPDAPNQLLDAAGKYGFVFIQNNDAGIPAVDIDRMFQTSKIFFDSPIEIKNSCAISSNKAGKNHGWLGRGDETLDPNGQKKPDVKEAFNMGEPIDGNFEQPIPSTLTPHVEQLVEFQNACDRVCQLILCHFAAALKLNEDWFTSRHDRSKGVSGTVFRLLYYPQIEDRDEDVDIRAGAHSDYGSITLLFQQLGQPGLEIKTPSGEWAPVPVDPKQSPNQHTNSSRSLPILVNIGDLLQDWTGGLLKSTVHRVIFPKNGDGGDRYSIAYFCHPLDDARLEPVPSKLVEEHAIKTGRTYMREGKSMTARDHLMNRLAATVKAK